MASPVMPVFGNIPMQVAPAPQPQNPAELQGQILKLKALQQQLQTGQQQQQLNQQGIQKNQIALNDEKAKSDAMRDWDGKDINDLPQLYLKHGATADAIMGLRSNMVDYQSKLGTADKTDLENKKTKDDFVAGQLDSISQLDPDKIPAALDELGQDPTFAKMLDPAERAQLPGVIAGLQQKAQSGADVKGALVELRNHHLADSQLIDLTTKRQAQQEKAADLQSLNSWLLANPGKTKADYDIAQTKAKATAEEGGKIAGQQGATPPGGAFGTTLDVQTANDWLRKNPGKTLSDYQKYEKTIPQVYQADQLTGQSLDMAAENYFSTGQLPTGMRSPAMSASIINRAAALHPNGTNDLAGNRAAYEANKKSYDNVTGTLDTLTAFENSAGKNLDQFLGLVGKLPDTGVPWLNTPVRLLNDKLVGNEWAPAVNAAKEVGLREIARVTNDPKLSGSLTDSARQEVQNFSPTNATLPQIKNVLNVLRTDMKNVEGSLGQQKADIGTRLGIKPSSSQATGTAPSPSTKVYSQSDVTAAVAAHPGLTAAQAEAAFNAKGWKKQ